MFWLVKQFFSHISGGNKRMSKKQNKMKSIQAWKKWQVNTSSKTHILTEWIQLCTSARHPLHAFLALMAQFWSAVHTIRHQYQLIFKYLQYIYIHPVMQFFPDFKAMQTCTHMLAVNRYRKHTCWQSTDTATKESAPFENDWLYLNSHSTSKQSQSFLSRNLCLPIKQMKLPFYVYD